eukprot:SRR837773.1871.p4 GENE.SRR837773.1871~~SRR837773.1871.p4  ORF type:complete len:100 (-),score=13.87 SRR837773.1871:9-308(-)
MAFSCAWAIAAPPRRCAPITVRGRDVLKRSPVDRKPTSWPLALVDREDGHDEGSSVYSPGPGVFSEVLPPGPFQDLEEPKATPRADLPCDCGRRGGSGE